MNPELTAQLIVQAAQTAVLIVQGTEAQKKSGADKKTIAKGIFAQLLAGFLPSLPSVLTHLLAGSSVQAAYHSTVADGSYDAATQAANAPASGPQTTGRLTGGATGQSAS